jgi:hypothetical protein
MLGMTSKLRATDSTSFQLTGRPLSILLRVSRAMSIQLPTPIVRPGLVLRP